MVSLPWDEYMEKHATDMVDGETPKQQAHTKFFLFQNDINDIFVMCFGTGHDESLSVGIEYWDWFYKCRLVWIQLLQVLLRAWFLELLCQYLTVNGSNLSSPRYPSND